ncbi:MAG TPA: glycosyl transferase family 2, partial [Thermoanaerobaculia bacterium]|nr:glycosyl transferase family 2 [Thermoanaerobaculia bacterium]
TSDDDAALRRVNQLLMPGGRVIIFVPAGKELYGSLDRGIGHQRRYERDELAEKLARAGFEVEHASYQNQFAKLAWFVNSKLLGRTALPSGQSRIFDYLVPLLRAVEGENPSSGLSLIAVGRKRATGVARAAAQQAETAVV